MKSEKVYSFIGNIAPVYDAFLFCTGHQKSIDYFVSNLPFKKDDYFRVLDAGCGTGLYSISILEQFPNAHVTSFDLDKKSVDRLKEKVLENKYENRNYSFYADVESDISEISNQKFNLIITSGVLEYVNPIKTITNLSGFLNSGGYFLNSPMRDTFFGRTISKLYACKIYSQAENIKNFEQNNFTLKRIINLPVISPSSFKECHIFQKN